MISTYSSDWKAIAAIPDFCSEVEQDIFVYHIQYPQGEEFSLRMRNQVMSEESPQIIHKYYLPFDHHFKDRDNARREQQIWTVRLNRPVSLERHIRYERGYKIFSHYTLKV